MIQGRSGKYAGEEGREGRRRDDGAREQVREIISKPGRPDLENAEVPQGQHHRGGADRGDDDARGPDAEDLHPDVVSSGD